MKRALALCSLAVQIGLGLSAGVATGCAAPGSVDGVVRHDGFTLRSDHPLTKPVASGRDRVVVLAEEDSETLRTVQLTLPNVATLPLGKAVSIGPVEALGDAAPQPSVEASVGKLDIETRSDGVQIVSATNATTASSVRGSLTLTEVDDAACAGHFHADLDDGGYVDGEFVAQPTQD